MDETQDYAGLVERFETDENLARMVDERMNSPRGQAIQRSYVSNRKWFIWTFIRTIRILFFLKIYINIQWEGRNKLDIKIR